MPSIYDMAQNDGSTNKSGAVTNYTVKPTIAKQSENGCKTPFKCRTCPETPNTKK
jgi:hypothetical protein